MKLIDLATLLAIATLVTTSQVPSNDDLLRKSASTENDIKQVNYRIDSAFANENIKSRNLVLKRDDNHSQRGDKIDGDKCDGYCNGRCDDKRIQGVCQGKCYGYCYNPGDKGSSASSSKLSTSSKTKSRSSSTKRESSNSTGSSSPRAESESSPTSTATTSTQTNSNSAAPLKRYDSWFNIVAVLLVLLFC